jgi:hypothetical protein
MPMKHESTEYSAGIKSNSTIETRAGQIPHSGIELKTKKQHTECHGKPSGAKPTYNGLRK